jgi:IS5 family transposase
MLVLQQFFNLSDEELNHPLSDTAKRLNRVKSAIRACVEHIFGSMAISMGGKLTRRIVLGRNEAWWGLKNMTFNFFRYLQRASYTTVAS